MENDITERIELILKEYELTPSAFSDKIDVQRSAMSHIFSRRNRPSLDVIQKILKKFPDINSSWLLNGTGKMKQLNLFDEEDIKPRKQKDEVKADDTTQKNLKKEPSDSRGKQIEDEKLHNTPLGENITFQRVSVSNTPLTNNPLTQENIPPANPYQQSNYGQTPVTHTPDLNANRPAEQTGKRNIETENAYPNSKTFFEGNVGEKVNQQPGLPRQPIVENSGLEQAKGMASAFADPEKEIDRIIIFYKDRTFISYKPE